MRVMVFFDLPVTKKSQRKAAGDFRKFLIKDGYFMVQFSVYVRVCNGIEQAEKHRARLKQCIPAEGSVRVMTVTEKQYERMDVLLGKKAREEAPLQYEQLTIF